MAVTAHQSADVASPADRKFDVVVVGAGFAGLFMLHKLRQFGYSACVLEAGSDVGGTWYWNRYPGARCDVESMQYSYSFSDELQQEWKWSEKFATQPEILRYINHVADRFDLRRDIRLDTRVVSATFDEVGNFWAIRTEVGDEFVGTHCVMATGCLSASRTPEIEGIEGFSGRLFHTGNWPHEPVDFSGRRVAVIGTGSSGIQAIPEIAKNCDSLVVFQRTPNFSIPARNQPMSGEYEQSWKSDYPARRQRAREQTRSGTIYEFAVKSALDASEVEREREFERRWEMGGANFLQSFNDLLINEDANHTAAEFVREKIRATVKSPEVAATLVPRGHPLGAKRICIDTDYYATFNRGNVSLVDLRRAPIERIEPSAVVTSERGFEVDDIVFATGYDAITGALGRIEIRGLGGRHLSEKWAHGPRAYLGLMSAGFPNLFMVTGPGSPSVISNMIVSIEQHVEWIAACLDYLRQRKLSRIDADIAAETAWVLHVNEVANATLYPRADSWYVGANIPGKPRVFMPYIGVDSYRRKCNEVARSGYEGFHLGAASAATKASA
jgi:cyclohexanone monooxygenase